MSVCGFVAYAGCKTVSCWPEKKVEKRQFLIRDGPGELNAWMEVIHEGCKLFDRIPATGKGPGNAVNVSFIQVGFGSCVLNKNLLLYMTHEKTGIVGPKSASLCNPSDLIIVLSIERETFQGEN